MYRRKESPPKKETFTVYSPVYVYIYIFIFIINPLLVSWFPVNHYTSLDCLCKQLQHYWWRWCDNRKRKRSCEDGMFCLDDMMSMSHDVGYSHVMDGCVSQLLYHQRLSFCWRYHKIQQRNAFCIQGKSKNTSFHAYNQLPTTGQICCQESHVLLTTNRPTDLPNCSPCTQVHLLWINYSLIVSLTFINW